ncbi:NACHT, LRR and PYD domains-containing protein 1 homolog isoform X1 [Electrophorus electricus]|uniref:FIIND domain-containing protein n=2 Tax=Electrophorus electricus TaxID=8005 RepID=A0A4W4FMI2_ELEEL|nr:NACHT, LRR and PYD domains-containing protein 1 homolog isoform X1 [Electrophorus electricus]
MANFGHTKEIEGGNGDIPPSDLTGNELENDVSSPDSTESSSDETSDEGERTDPENGKSCSERLSLDTEASTGDHMKQHCEKCEVLQRPSYEVVTPRKISRDRMLLFLEDEGVYECAQTGLVFEVTRKAQIRYRVLSWCRFGGYLSESWTFAGPIFDVDCDPSILKSIQFPHSLCLADQDSEMKFSVLHVKDQRGLIEPSVDHSRSHIKWSVSSLSPVGPIVQATKPAEHHGVVLVYKEVGQQDSYSFRVYFATNNHSDIKDIQKELRNSKKRYMKMEKPPTCQRLLGENRKYRLLSEPQGDITPEDIQFTLAVVKMKGYFEVFFEQCPPFKLSLIEADSEQTVWAATIRAGDCTVHAVDKTQKRSESRKRSNSTSEEELTNKRARCNDESDGARAPRSADLSDKQLMQVAKVLGKEWKSMAICYLDLTNQDLEEIEASEEDLHMRKFRTLDRWRRRQAKGDAGVEQLHNKLDHEDVPNEVVDVLKGMRELS